MLFARQVGDNGRRVDPAPQNARIVNIIARHAGAAEPGAKDKTKLFQYLMAKDRAASANHI
jgi:hypothetical protein